MGIPTFLVLAIAFVEALPTIIQLVEQQRRMATRSILRKRRRDRQVPPRYLVLDKIFERLAFIERITQETNRDCFKNLRMSTTAFKALCTVLQEECGLLEDRYVSIFEKVAIFLRILAHHQKNRVLQTDFQRSGQTISKVFNEVLCAVIKLRRRVIAHPVSVDDTTTDKRFKWFKGCLGALDDTYVPLHVTTHDQPRYRTRKGHLATNVLGVCDIHGRFVYMLAGWEGSAADGRVLRDAITRTNGLKIPNGLYYLCDNGYANGPGFLTPYRQTRYHLQEWANANRRPQNMKELFNLRHASTRNIIERTFGVLKKRFSILRNPSFYPIDTQCHIILCCSLLHNFISNVTPRDPLLDPAAPLETVSQVETEAAADVIQNVNPSPAWSLFRDTLANEMWQAYTNSLNS